MCLQGADTGLLKKDYLIQKFITSRERGVGDHSIGIRAFMATQGFGGLTAVVTFERRSRIKSPNDVSVGLDKTGVKP